MRHTYFLFFISILFISSNCDTTGNSEEDAETLAAKAKLIEADAGFSIDLFKTIHASDTSSNIFISPLSVSMALGMTMNGATGNTLAEMQNTLGFSDLTQEEINKGYRSLKRGLENADDEVEFAVANSVWANGDYTVKQEFTNTVEEYFDAETASLNFSDPKTVDVINDWVSDNTNERITKVINGISPYDRMFLINAVYFNGSWKHQFDPEATELQQFYLDQGESVDVEMMKQKNFAGYYISDDVTILELPYGNEAFSMLFIKPSQQSVTIDELIQNQFSKESLTEWQTKITRDTAQYFIPKLELEYKRKMNDDLTSLGMEQAFLDGAAELDNLFEDIDNLFISSVLHKTFLKMDEEGTEAAGATVVTISTTSVGPAEPPVIVFDQPYLVILREKASGAILFIGKIGHPEFSED